MLSLDNLDIEGIFTHFCSADEENAEDAAYTKMQHDRAARMIDALAEKGFHFSLRHCCNSGATALIRSTRGIWCAAASRSTAPEIRHACLERNRSCD